MPTDIYKAVDCTKRRIAPHYTIRIDPRRKIISPGELTTLHALHAPYECDPGCYRWYVAHGDGIVSPEYGKQTNHRAPNITTNTDCQYSIAVQLWAGTKQLDYAVLSLVTYTDIEVAYDKITIEREIQYLPNDPAFYVTGQPTTPPAADTNRLRLYTWAYQYDCLDTLINKYSWSTRDFVWQWRGSATGWVLYYMTTMKRFASLPQAIAYYDGLDAHRDGEIIDKRSRAARARGCCPPRLLEYNWIMGYI
jgi:hypothetical protein